LCTGLRTVDLACGSGYGSAILAASAEQVTGVDIDKATIEVANAGVGVEHGVRFVAADAVEWLADCRSADIDAIVCFEGLEHLPDLEPALAELKRLAGEGVKLVLSVPNSAMWEEENPYHVTDFSVDSAHELIQRLGGDGLLVQNLAEGSLIVDPERHLDELESDLRWPERAEMEYANHFIGLVGFAEDERQRALGARLQVAYAPAYNRHIRNIEVTNQTLWRTNARLGWSSFSRFDAGASAAVRQGRQRLMPTRTSSTSCS
jgi:SAM-dependent methyltransferase